MERITEARIRLTMSHPWWAALVLKLEPVKMSAEDMILLCGMPTAATDGARLIYCEEFIETLDDSQLTALIAHEALHPGLLHHLRRGERDPGKWNVAADHAINLILTEDGFELPEGGYCDPQYAGMSAEEIYNILPGGNYEMPAFGIIIDGQGNEGKSAREWSEAMTQAMHAAMRAGKLPGHAERLLSEVNTPPKVNWLDLLIRFVETHAGRDDYSWRRPSRRGLANEIILPSMIGNRCKPIAVCVDTSASMSENELQEALSEIEHCVNRVNPTTLYLIAADADVQSVKIYEGDFTPPKTLEGGGGTDFRPALKKAVDLNCCCVIYFTDMYGEFGKEPTIPSIWITESKETAPYGETIQL